VADPATTKNCHHLTARGDFGTLNVMVESRPFAANPKSSELTALSLVAEFNGTSPCLV
jgi:aspartate dehydrogenase